MSRINFDQPLVIDGAMATELEKRGVETNNALWSAMALIHDPDAVIAVHKSYFEAGANVAITDSYQANLPAFEAAGLSVTESRRLISESVRLAQRARDEYRKEEGLKRPLLIAGSVGPYGAYLADGSEYTGNYQLTKQQYQNFHRERMQILAAAGADLFAFEPQPNFEETQALVDLLENEFPEMSAWVSFSVNQKGQLCDGTSLNQAVAYFESHSQVAAIGINCTAMTNIEKLVKQVAWATSKPIIVYPNNGDIYDPVTKSWQTVSNAPAFSDLVPKWRAAGASLIGGCCRTTPADISQIASTMASN